jgi:hypothetical protein
MQSKALAIILLLISCAPSSLWAGCSFGSGLERLENYCLVHEVKDKRINRSVALFFDQRLQSQGYNSNLSLVNTSPAKTFNVSISPTFYYSRNINGGNPAQNLELGRLSFVGDPAFYAKEGLLIGAALKVGGRRIYGEGRYLNYNLNTSYAYSAKHSLAVATSSVSACSINHIADWWYLDLCGNAGSTRKEITTQGSENLNLALVKAFSGGSSTYHKIRIEGIRQFSSNYVQDKFLFGLDTIHPKNVTSGVTVAIGESVNNQLATRVAISGHLGLSLNKKRLSVKASYNDSDGGKLLGFDRSDEAFNLSVSYPLTDYVSANLGYHKTNSSIDYYDTKYPTFGLQLKSLSF